MPRGVPGSTPLCSLPGCTQPSCAKGLCRTHYMRHSRGLPLDNPIPKIRRPNEAPESCAVAGCQAHSKTANIGLCSMHYERQRAGRPLDAPRRRARGAPPLPCEVTGCDRPARKLKLCGMHYQRLRNSGKLGSAESRIDEAIIARNRMLVGSGKKACSGCKRVLPTACFYQDARSRDGVTSTCKDCKNAWQKQYQQENTAAIQAYQSRYRVDPAHRQLAREKTARYRIANPDRVREAMAAWRAKPENQRIARERTRTWRLENPRQRSEQARRRSALKKSGVATRISLELLDTKLAYWGWRCWINGPGCTVDPEHWDHVKPLSKGGAHMLANLRPACGHCNRRKHDRWPFPATRVPMRLDLDDYRIFGEGPKGSRQAGH
jgi:5-methylcytosine-specific restriction endonuclease McrA